MRFEKLIAGQKIIWENGRKTQMRVEVALSMPWADIQPHIDQSTAIKQQIFYSGFSYPDGTLVPEAIIDSFTTKDEAGLKALMEAIAAEAKAAPLSEAPLLKNSGSGAPSDSSPKPTGKRRAGKSTRPSKVAPNTSGKPKNKV